MLDKLSITELHPSLEKTFLFLVFETGYCYTPQAGLGLQILLRLIIRMEMPRVFRIVQIK
jgi:hypothetical protein